MLQIFKVLAWNRIESQPERCLVRNTQLEIHFHSKSDVYVVRPSGGTNQQICQEEEEEHSAVCSVITRTHSVTKNPQNRPVNV